MTREQQLAYLRAWALDAKTTAGLPALGAAIDFVLAALEARTAAVNDLREVRAGLERLGEANGRKGTIADLLERVDRVLAELEQ